MKSKICLMMIVASASISGCVKSDGCAWVEPIYLTERDAEVISGSLAEDIIVLNESWEANCQ